MADPTSTYSCKQQIYTTAFALNNISVSILEQGGNVLETRKTFEDNLSLFLDLQTEARESRTPAMKLHDSAGLLEEQFCKASEMLNSASKRLIICSSEKIKTTSIGSAPPPSVSSTLPSIAADIFTFDDGEDDLSTLKSSFHYGPSATVVFVARLRGEESSASRELLQGLEAGERTRDRRGSHVSIPLAMVLYNHGVSCMLACTQTTVPSRCFNRERMLAGALQSLSMASSLLASYTLHSTTLGDEDDDLLPLTGEPMTTQSSRKLFLALLHNLVLFTLLQTLRLQNAALHLSVQYRQSLAQLQEQISALEVLQDWTRRAFEARGLLDDGSSSIGTRRMTRTSAVPNGHASRRSTAPAA